MKKIWGYYQGQSYKAGHPSARILGSFRTRIFKTQTAIGREHVARLDSGVCQIFILIISNGEKIVIMVKTN